MPNNKFKLAAFWVKDHFLLKTFNINFGGKFLYNFIEGSTSVQITRQVNSKYISSFYSDVNSNLELVSCFVGKNGSGKSTIIDLLRQSIKRNILGMNVSFKRSILIFEDSCSGEILIREFNPEYSMLSFEQKERGSEHLIEHTFKTIDINFHTETVFYSPFLNLNENYFNDSSSKDIDISLSNIIRQDVETNTTKERRNFLIDHKYENIFREFDFLNSSLAKELLKDFNIPNYKTMYLILGGPFLNPSNTSKNIPFDIISFHEKLYKKWEEEIYSTERVITPDLNENKKIIKLWFLKELIASLFTLLDGNNSFSEKRTIRIHINRMDNLSLQNALYLFLDNYYFEGHEAHVLPVPQIKKLVSVSFEIINKLSNDNFIDRDKLGLSFAHCKKIMIAHKKFIHSIGPFHHEEKSVSFIDFSPNHDMSSGEKAILNLFSRFYAGIEEIKRKKTLSDSFPDNKYEPTFFLLLLDEADLGFHPTWKKKYVKHIIEALPRFFEAVGTSVQIIFTTHDPLSLSDMPDYNVTYLDKVGKSEYRILSYGIDKNRPYKSFGANISNLLSDSFFVENGLVGEFAIMKIDKTIKWLNDKEDKKNEGYHKKIIDIIDEPLLQKKLAEMYSKKTENKSLEIEILDEAIRDLENKRDNLKL